MFVLHIGLKKSGSSSIQSFLMANQDALRAMSIDFAATGRKQRKAHHNFAHEAMGNAKFDAAQGTLANLAQASTDRRMARVMISSEMFEGCDAVAVAKIKAGLGDVGRDFRIVLIIRDLLDLIPSSYAQKIRFGMNVFDFDTFFDERMRQSRVDYFETASRWGDVFGWERLRVRPLDTRYLKNGDLIDDFLDAAGVDLLDPRIGALERPGLVNAAASWKTLEALRGLHSGRHGLPDHHPLVRNRDAARNRRQGKVIEEAAREVGGHLNWNAERGRHFTRAQAERVVEIYSLAITALNARLPMALPAPLNLEDRGFVEREFLPDVSQISPAELRAFYDALADLVLGGAKKAVPEPEPETKPSHEPAPASASAIVPESPEAVRAARRAERIKEGARG